MHVFAGSPSGVPVYTWSTSGIPVYTRPACLYWLSVREYSGPTEIGILLAIADSVMNKKWLNMKYAFASFICLARQPQVMILTVDGPIERHILAHLIHQLTKV